MICSFYGIKQDVELIRDLCCFSKTGVSLLALQHAAEKLGFESIGVKCKLEELNEMPLPCILHWNQGHYVVLYKIQKRGNDFVFFVSDPIGYRFSYSSKEFSNCWLSADDQWAAHTPPNSSEHVQLYAAAGSCRSKRHAGASGLHAHVELSY